MPGAAVELEDPLGGVVEEVAVVGDRDDGAREALQELLEPVDRFGVEVVGRLVEQQHVGLRQQHPAQGDTALLAARQLADHRVPRREAERIGGDLELHVGVLAARGRDDGLELGLLGCELVEVGIGLAVLGIDLVEPLLRSEGAADAFLDRLAHGLVRVHHRLLSAGSRSSGPASASLRPRCRWSMPAMIFSRCSCRSRSGRARRSWRRKNDSEMFLRIWRFGGTILPTRFIVKTY